MNRLRSKNLSWSDKMGIIRHFQLSDQRACAAFGCSMMELKVAYSEIKFNKFSPNFNQNFDVYKEELGKVNVNTPPPIFHKGEFVTATKPQRTKKRGPKSSKIKTAFKNIPTKPVDVHEFAKKHGVSLGVLRQGKRFDKSNRGTTHVKKDKLTNKLVIWRETN